MYKMNDKLIVIAVKEQILLMPAMETSDKTKVLFDVYFVA